MPQQRRPPRPPAGMAPRRASIEPSKEPRELVTNTSPGRGFEMDKFKPVLTHIFWILFVVALLVPAIGWFMGTGKLAAAIDERIAALNSLNPQDGATVPNDRWIEKVAEVKEERQQRLDTAADFLWSQQQQYMTWPRGMQQFVEGKIFEDDFDDVTPLNIYRNRFDAEVEKLRQIVDPYEWDYDANRW